MPLQPGNSKAVIEHNFHELTYNGSRPRSHKQITAIVLSNARKHPNKRAAGGGIADVQLPSPPPSLASGGAGPSFPGGTLNSTPSYGGLGYFMGAPSAMAPGAGGIPYALQMQAMMSAQQAQQMPQIKSAGMARGGMPGVQKTPKGGIMGSLNAKPPRSLGRITEPTAAGGFIHSAIPGRTDQLAMNVAHGSHVIPADVVSAFGQGNSLAGAHHLDMTLRSLPQGFAEGGATDSKAKTHEPILAAGGEYIVPPEDVIRVGKGDEKKGHDILDKMIVKVRKHAAKRMLKLPGPKK